MRRFFVKLFGSREGLLFHKLLAFSRVCRQICQREGRGGEGGYSRLSILFYIMCVPLKERGIILAPIVESFGPFSLLI